MVFRLRQLFIQAKSHQGFRRYAANTSWMFAEQILRMVAGLLVGIWVARYLGPNQFGVFSYAVAFAALFNSIAKLGLDSIVVRDLVNEPTKHNLYLGTAFWLKLVGAIAMLGVMALAVLFTSNDATTNLYVFIVASGAIFQSFEVVDFYFQSKVLSRFVSISKLVQLFISSLLKLYLLFTGSDLIWFVIVTLVDQITLAASLYAAFRHQQIGKFYNYFDFTVAKKMLSISWPLIVGGLIIMIQSRVDQIAIKEIVGNNELGYYSSSIRLIEFFNFVPAIIISSLFPAILNAKQKSKELYESRLLSLYKMMMVFFICVAVPIYIFGDEIILFLYGSAYAPAGPLLSLMVFRLFFVSYGVVRHAYLMSENLIKYTMFTIIAGAFVSILLNFFLVPIYHSKGAIFASAISFFTSTFLFDFFYFKTRRNFIAMIKSMMII